MAKSYDLAERSHTAARYCDDIAMIDCNVNILINAQNVNNIIATIIIVYKNVTNSIQISIYLIRIRIDVTLLALKNIH